MVDLRAVQLGRVACSASGWGRTPALQWSLLRPSGFRSRIGVWGMLSIAGITMALRRPHKRRKMVTRRAVSRRNVSLAAPHPFWIPAFGGKTSLGAGPSTREAILVPIAHAGWRRHTKE